MCHTQEPYAWAYGQLVIWIEVLPQCYLVNCVLTLFAFKPHHNFFFCIVKWKHMKRFFGGSFQLFSSPENRIRQQKRTPCNATSFVRVNDSRPTDTSEILMPMPRPGQEPSIYIFLSPFKATDFMHPKWEGCIVINSLIFVVVCKNILYCLNLGTNYLWTKPASNKKRLQSTSKNHIQAYSLVKQGAAKRILF